MGKPVGTKRVIGLSRDLAVNILPLRKLTRKQHGFSLH
jgi:hypothetical protein